MDNHPIIPSSELINQWETLYFDEGQNLDVVLIQAYQAGADQELEAWCDFMGPFAGAEIRDARRPKPPSLKKQALEQLECVNGILRNQGIIKTDTIRRALEALPDD